MSEILYIKFEQCIRTYNRTLTLGEAASMKCADQAVLNRLKTEKLYTFQDVRKGSHSCAARQVLSILDAVERIHCVYPNLEVQNMGETDFVVEYSTKRKENPALCFIKAALICLICFFGSAFSIMAFNNDVASVDLFGQLYSLFTGQPSDGFTILEFTYSLGLSAGIVVFFNHVGGRRLVKDPTPIEVEMRLYEEDVNTTLISAAARNGSREKEI